MKKGAAFLAACMCVLCLTGCPYWGPGVNDYDMPLVNGYRLYILGWRCESQNITVVRPDYSPVVEEDIAAIGWNADFLLAACPNGGGTDYWIVDWRAPAVSGTISAPDTVYGPLDAEQFRKKQEELHVPASVELKPVAKLHPSHRGESGSFTIGAA